VLAKGAAKRERLATVMVSLIEALRLVIRAARTIYAGILRKNVAGYWRVKARFRATSYSM